MVQSGKSLQKKTKDDVENALHKQHDGDISPNDEGLRYELSVWTPISFILSIVSLACTTISILLYRHEIENEEIAIFWILAMQLGAAVFCFIVGVCNKSERARCLRSIRIRTVAVGGILVSIAGIIGFAQLTVMKTVDPQSCQYFLRMFMLIQSVINIALYTLGFGLICLCT